jgi:hypothetical protein
MGLFSLGGSAGYSQSQSSTSTKPTFSGKFLKKLQEAFPSFQIGGGLGGAGTGGFNIGAANKFGGQQITSGLPQFRSLVDLNNPQQFQKDFTKSIYDAGAGALEGSEEQFKRELDADLQKRGLANSPAAFAAGSPVDQFNRRRLEARQQLANESAVTGTQTTLAELARATGLDLSLLEALFNISGSQKELGLASAGSKSSTSGSTFGGSITGGFGK